jgi:hypothetical protein
VRSRSEEPGNEWNAGGMVGQNASEVRVGRDVNPCENTGTLRRTRQIDTKVSDKVDNELVRFNACGVVINECET